MYDKLDEREQYWIKFYDSIKNGYNTSSGGQLGTNYYELDDQEKIIEYYYSCHNKAQTCKYFNITDYKLRQLLLKNNLPTDFSNYGKHIKKAVKIVELDKIFDSETELAKFFVENKICETQKIECALARVNHGLKNHKKVYGYTLEEVT